LIHYHRFHFTISFCMILLASFFCLSKLNHTINVGSPLNLSLMKFLEHSSTSLVPRWHIWNQSLSFSLHHGNYVIHFFLETNFTFSNLGAFPPREFYLFILQIPFYKIRVTNLNFMVTIKIILSICNSYSLFSLIWSPLILAFSFDIMIINSKFHLLLINHSKLF